MPIRVLVVDDSLFTRKVLCDLIDEEPGMEVVGTASDGVEACERVVELEPDVVIMDVEMPRMDGLAALRRIMRLRPTPVVMFSALTRKGAEVTLEALSSGAVDFVAKPYGKIMVDLSEIREELLRKIRSAAVANLRMVTRRPIQARRVSKVRAPYTGRPLVAVAIGASTGGPSAVAEVLSRFPEDLPAAVFLTQHMPPFFTRVFASNLDKRTEVRVKEAVDGEPAFAGTVYVAPGDYHMLVVRRRGRIVIELDRGPKVNNVRPSADPMMMSVAKVFGSCTVGILLTGMGRDGADGMTAIKAVGGFTIAQDRDTCVVFGMPKAAIEAGVVDKVLPLDKIGDEAVNVARLKYLAARRWVSSGRSLR